MTTPNRLYFGDCLDVMREQLPDESVDLIYLDPPFNSKRLYNAFIGQSQWMAFDDTWRWAETEREFAEAVQDPRLSNTLNGLRQIHGESAELAYLSYIANRLRECYRVLKATGSLYLHCDPTMSHSLKLILDGTFGNKNQFRNEIVWAYRTGGVSKRWFGRKHDVLLFYSKSKHHTFNLQKERSYSTSSPPGFSGIEKHRDEHGRWYTMSSMRDVWEINAIGRTSKERLGYPTQKPLALLNRIILASSNENDVVMDPFCGCGTTIHAAQALNRRWIGIDICVNACQVIEQRMKEHFDSQWSDIEFVGIPTSVDDARVLAGSNRFGFEKWAASLVDGLEPKSRLRGADGIDGFGRLPIRPGKFVEVVSQVKGDGAAPTDIQAFDGARKLANADLGIFICFADRIMPSVREMAQAMGKFMDIPVVQIYTIEDFFLNRKPKLPIES